MIISPANFRDHGLFVARLLQTGGQISLEITNIADRCSLCRGGRHSPGETWQGGETGRSIIEIFCERSLLRKNDPTSSRPGWAGSSSWAPVWSAPVSGLGISSWRGSSSSLARRALCPRWCWTRDFSLQHFSLSL